MESQLNIFTKGINSDLAPMYQPNSGWTFPTLNARIYNNGRGYSITNLPGNTNQDNVGAMEGAELEVMEGYTIVGAVEAGGIAFIFSVNEALKRMEIGSFPSPNVGGGFVRVYAPLRNIVGEGDCNFPISTFGWNTTTRMKVEVKIEYDNTVNMYICTGKDMLRIINNAFDIKTGVYLVHRQYKRQSFEEATRILKTPPLNVINNIITSKDIKIENGGGKFPYGNCIFFFRYVKETYDKTLWLFETPPINIGVDTFDDTADGKFTQGAIYSKNEFSSETIIITIPVTDAYRKVEVGYSFKASEESESFETIEEKGILSTVYQIKEGTSKMDIVIRTLDDAMDFDEEENLRTIEMIPKDIHAVNNVLYQANMSNSVLDVNLLREFFKRVKVRCVVKDGELPMPTDKEPLDSGLQGEDKICRLEKIFYDEDFETHSYYGTDAISVDMVSEDSGTLFIELNDDTHTLNEELKFYSVEPSLELNYDFKIIFDDIEYINWAGFEIHTTDELDSWLLVDTANSKNYYYNTVKYPDETFYSVNGDNYVEHDFITIVNDTCAYVKYNGNSMAIDEYCAIAKIIHEHHGRRIVSYSLYRLATQSTPQENLGVIKITNKTVAVSSPISHEFSSFEESIVSNDAFYSKQEHIIEDVGYFGGEIYAFSLMAVDVYGNKYGTFPCTGIDHYYANKESDLLYDAYEPAAGVISPDRIKYANLIPDEDSPYTIEKGKRTFKKNQYGIYRFPSRSNYVKNLKDNDSLDRGDKIQFFASLYKDDAFNLTHRVYTSRVGDKKNYTNVLRIFKVCFDFSEAYNWLTQYDAISGEYGDSSSIINLHSKLAKIVFLRAERTGAADNLMLQGIIQKPNTIIPYPKYHEYETLDLKEDDRAAYSHVSFNKLISYNFDTIRSREGNFLHLHGQLGNSSIKLFDDADYSGDNNDVQDAIYPYKLSKLKSYYGKRLFNAKSAIYSGKFSHHKVDYIWDGYESYPQEFNPLTYEEFRATPALGAVSFGVYIPNGSIDTYHVSSIDVLWGEMGGQPRGTPSNSWNKRNSYPQQNIFVDAIDASSKTDKLWYNYGGGIIKFSNSKGQYAKLIQYPLAETGGSIKIPFFKGYMPCVQRIGRTEKSFSKRMAQTRMYTTRCMYHPYDKTRAFFSPDFIYGRGEMSLEAAKYIKPIRKTIYSGLEGLAGYENLNENTDIREAYFKADGWKTFFAQPSVMDVYQKPLSEKYQNYESREAIEDWYNKDLDAGKRIIEEAAPVADLFYLHKAIKDSGLSLKQNPMQLLHSVRKYFKVDNPRECCPIGALNALIGSGKQGKSPNPDQKVGERGIPYVKTSGGEMVDIDANSSSIAKYISYARDFATVSQAQTAPWFRLNNFDGVSGKDGSSSFIQDKIKTLNGGIEGLGWGSVLFMTLDMDLSSSSEKTAARSFLASNRSIEFAPYIALELDVNNSAYKRSLTKEYPSTDSYSEDDYRYMLDYTSHYYDKTVKLSAFRDKKTNGRWYWENYDKSNTFNNMESRTDYAHQYKRSDFYVDYNYEDLTVVNLYKTDPENIFDIVEFYDITSEEYFVIGEALSRDVLSKDNSHGLSREVVLGRGDCFLDRTYFKHTTWMPTNLSMGNSGGYSSNDSPNWKYKEINNNWEFSGGEPTYMSYVAHFTSATSSYAHGTTLGVITENRYNIALKGKADDITMNSYPYSMLMENKESEYGRANRKNRVMITPNDNVGHEGSIPYLYNLSYNSGYHNMLSPFSYVMENDISFLKYSYPNRIRQSYYAGNKSIEDGWSIFDLGAYHDYTPSYGQILRISDIDGELVSFAEQGIFQHYHEGDQVTVTSEQTLSVGGNLILSREARLLADIGLSHQHALVKTPLGIYGIDTKRSTLWRVRGEREYGRISLGVEDLSLSKGISDWYSDYMRDVNEASGMLAGVSDITSIIQDIPFSGVGVVAGYDRQHKEVLFTFLNKYNPVTLCFFETLDFYTSLYTFTPYLYFNINDNMFSVINKRGVGRRAYMHNNPKSYRQHFYNTFLGNDFALTITVNGLSEQRNTVMLSKQFESMFIESQQHPFSRVIYETKDQRANHLFMDEEKWWSMPEYLSHHWQVPIQIDNTSSEYDEDLYYEHSSMLGTWLKTTLIHYGSNLNKEIFISNIVTNFNISNS